jgi:hypothetical protein
MTLEEFREGSINKFVEGFFVEYDLMSFDKEKLLTLIGSKLIFDINEYLERLEEGLIPEEKREILSIYLKAKDIHWLCDDKLLELSFIYNDGVMSEIIKTL